MNNTLKIIEEKITEFWTNIFKYIFFFLESNHQSFCVSLLHYVIFIIGFGYFFLFSYPGDIFRIVFFIFVLMGALSYFIFNKCFFTSIELKLCKDKNGIQKLMDTYFGEEIEGNVSSKIVLSVGSIIMGLVLLKDHGILFNTV